MSARSIDLVVTDLDGTLWDRSVRPHPRTVAAWSELERRGVPVLVATGRRVGSTRSALADAGLAPSAVCLNGALGLDLAGGRRFHRAVIGADHAAGVLDAFVASGLWPCVYVDHDDVAVFVGEEPSTHPDHLASFGSEVAVADLTEVCATHAILAFSLLGGEEQPLATVAAAIAGAGIAHLDADPIYGGTSLTVAGPAMSKWNGVLAFCADRALDPSRVLAIGDGANDLELLAGAAVAVVPEGAHPAARAAADHVVESPATGGWASILDLL